MGRSSPRGARRRPRPVDELQSDEIAARRRLAALNERPAQGPPEHDGAEPGTPTAPITWLFDPESFAPTGKLVGDAHYAIVTDHLGTPTAMYDAAGTEVWSATIDAFGDLRHLTGTRQACPFRWPGQYEDTETGLYYNRFRYYDSDSDEYLRADPIRILGGTHLYGYPLRPLATSDVFGLSCNELETEKDTAVFWSGRTNGVGGESVARDIAEAHGGVTLEKILEERGIVLPPWDKTNPVVTKAWRDASETYAKGASGTVRAVVGEHLRPGNVWEGSEFNALKANPNVDKIIKIAPSSRAQTVIWSKP